MHEVVSPLQGRVVGVLVQTGADVHEGTTLVVIESMKMEHAVAAAVDGTVGEVLVGAGDGVRAGDPLLVLVPGAVSDERRPETEAAATERADLAAVVERHAVGLDPARPDAVERRRKTGQRTARENIADLCDPDSFVEFAPLAIAAQRRRREIDDLIARTPADGLVGGIGRIDGRPVVVASYDYTVLAGTQGFQNHRKKDRLFELAERQRLPVVLFAEGGGGRPGDTDAPGVSGLDTMAFHLFASLSGTVPLVGITSGRCFAGNAALLGCCDVVIATEGANIGMGGPAMIEGGGLGEYAPEDIGPLDEQVANGVVDLRVDDEAAAVAAARRYLDFLAGPAAPGSGAGPGRPAAPSSPSGAPSSTRSVTSSPGSPTRTASWSSGTGSAWAWSRRWPRSTATPSASWPTTPGTSVAPSTPTGRTRRLASSSTVTATASRSSSSATRPASWSAPRPSGPVWSATSAGCS